MKFLNVYLLIETEYRLETGKSVLTKFTEESSHYSVLREEPREKDLKNIEQRNRVLNV